MEILTTFPSNLGLRQAVAATPDFMRPSHVPYAVCLQGALSDEECDEIQETLNHVDPYTVRGCGAVTREIVAAPCLDPIETIGRNINDRYFGFDLDPGQHSWLQTYVEGGDYHRHMDGSPGQTRKLTAVALLSHSGSYSGGNLTIVVPPKSYSVPRSRGTIVVFQHWVEHEVEQTRGLNSERQTINMGFWGPPFK